jgi:peroxiredoxin Q/BCP
MLAAGTRAPDFTLRDSRGRSVSLRDFAGKKVVLYFYPKDDTPGCTVEAKDFSEFAPRFYQANTVVLGVSKDSVESHDAFQCKYGLELSLLSDPEHHVIELYGAWREKNHYGNRTLGTVRSTYLIDENGLILRAWDNVNALGHVAEVYEAARSE